MRFSALEDQQYRKSKSYYKDLQEQFRRASNEIQLDLIRWYQRLADNNEISLASAKKLLETDALKEFHWDVKQYIQYGRENAINRQWMKELENASARVHINALEAMKLQIQQHVEQLFTEYEAGMTEFLQKSYIDHYYKTAFEIAKGTNVGTYLYTLNVKQIEAFIKQPWAMDGQNFSDRIWKNKQKLIKELHNELSQHVIRGNAPEQSIRNIVSQLGVSKSNAKRLVLTESAAIASQSQKNCLEYLEVEQYEILATLDHRTSQICQDLDGKTFLMKEYKIGKTAPPFHPFVEPLLCHTLTTNLQRVRGESPETVVVKHVIFPLIWIIQRGVKNMFKKVYQPEIRYLAEYQSIISR